MMKGTLVIDPGHGGANRGCVAHGHVEKHLTLRLAKTLQAMCRSAGLAAEVTRENDDTVAFTQRLCIARRHGAAQVVSLHFDSSPESAAGRLTCYYEAGDAQSRVLAQRLLHCAPPVVAGGRQPIAVEASGWKARACHVVRSFEGISTLLVECAYLTNRRHAEFLHSTGIAAIAASVLAAYTSASVSS